jgi:hypothetical protein
VAAGANAYYLWNEHWSHWGHLPPLEERTEYPYQNIRTKNYQWGDGDKVSSVYTACLMITNNGGRLCCKFLLLHEPTNNPCARGQTVCARRLGDGNSELTMNSWNEEVNFHKKDK